MALLINKGELCVCELVDALELSQGVVSRHLAYLKNNSLVTGRREGIWMYYQINQKEQIAFAPLITMISQSIKKSDELTADLQRLKNNRNCA